MTLLNSNNPLPDEKPEQPVETKADEQKKPAAAPRPQSRPAPKMVVHKGRKARRPKAEERKRASIFGRLFAPKPKPAAPDSKPPVAAARTASRPAPRPAAAKAAQARPVPVPAEPARKEEPAALQAVSQPPAAAETDQRTLSRNGKGINPGLRLRAMEAAGRTAPAAPPAETAAVPPRVETPVKRSRSKWADFFMPRKPRVKESLLAAQRIYKVLSVVVDVVLVILVLVLALAVRSLYTTLNGVLSGLYDNFVRMDNAVIDVTIPVDKAAIPLDFVLPVVQEETNVTLTQPVTITGARVTINSGAITINNAPATVVLPSGTTLPVSLRMDVPVQTTLYVDLSVPVKITMSESNPAGNGVLGLHEAFYGLQNTLGPFYCLFNQEAQDAGGPVCQQGIYLPKKTNP